MADRPEEELNVTHVREVLERLKFNIEDRPGEVIILSASRSFYPEYTSICYHDTGALSVTALHPTSKSADLLLALGLMLSNLQSEESPDERRDQ